MGRFFSSVQIKNNCGREQFVKSFCDVMKKRDLVPCSEEESSVSYILAFSQSGKWVTLASDKYRDDPGQVKIDARQTAAEMKTSSFGMEVVDSDFAILELYKDSSAADTVIVGEGSGYGFDGNDSKKGKQECWEELLASGKTWEQLSEIWNKDEVFVEGALYEAASVLGIEREYMVSDHENLSGMADKDTNVALLFFKNKITVSEGGAKKLTMNAAFKKVFGEALEPLGFVKAKTKYPHYIRFVDNSFIQIIGLKKESEYDFNITAGIATIYRSEIDLNCSPRMNCNWMIGISEFYKRSHIFDYDGEYKRSIMYFGFPKIENDRVINEFERALNEVKKWVLPEFEKVQTLRDVIDYLYTIYFMGLDIHGPDVQFYRHINDRDGLFCFELDDPYEIVDRREEIALKRALYKVEHNIDGFTEADYVKSCEDIKQSNKERREYIGNILNNKQLYDETISEINKRKEKNIGILRSYGLDI